MGRALGIDSKTLDAAAIAALEPGIRMNVEGGVYFPQDRHLTLGPLDAPDSLGSEGWIGDVECARLSGNGHESSFRAAIN